MTKFEINLEQSVTKRRGITQKKTYNFVVVVVVEVGVLDRPW
jgi:hypothetical protein